MSYLPKEPRDKDPKKVTPTRLAVWVFVGAVGLYFIITGVIGVINHG
ncbi:hypothetical protein [Glaciihabitans sp. UYNi722]